MRERGVGYTLPTKESRPSKETPLAARAFQRGSDKFERPFPLRVSKDERIGRKGLSQQQEYIRERIPARIASEKGTSGKRGPGRRRAGSFIVRWATGKAT